MDTYQAALRDYQRGNYDLAIEGFREFVAASPRADLADNAAYWIGESLFSQKKYRDAIEQFDSVVSNYPKSDKVGCAAEEGLRASTSARAQEPAAQCVARAPKSQAALARQKLDGSASSK
jgi:TolA-binding protein